MNFQLLIIKVNVVGVGVCYILNFFRHHVTHGNITIENHSFIITGFVDNINVILNISCANPLDGLFVGSLVTIGDDNNT